MHRLEALEGPALACVELLAAAHDELSLTLLSRALTALGLRNGSRAFTATTTGELLAPALESGLLVAYQRIGLAKEVAEPLRRQLIATSRFEPLAAAVAELAPLKTKQYWGYHVDQRQGTKLRELRRALLAGDAERVQLALDLGAEPSHLFDWLTSPLDTDLIARLPVPLRDGVLWRLHDRVYFTMTPAPGLDGLIERLHTIRPSTRLATLQATVALSHGQIDPAITQDLPDPRYEAWRLLMIGDVKASTTLYAKALAAERARLAARKIVLEGHAASYLPIAYLLSGQASRKKQARSYLALLAESYFSPDAGAPHLRVLVEPDAPPAPDPTHPVAVLHQGLAGQWLERPVPPDRLERAATFADRLGWLWVAAELRTLTGGEPLPGTVALHSHRQAVPLWEKRLGELEAALGATKQPKATKKKKRIAWTLGVYGSDVDLEAREQGWSRKGWSVGRPIALKRLAERAADIPSMTPQDLAIAACLSVHHSRSWGYPELEFRWSAAVWDALAGCDRVFDHAGEPVTIAKGQPRARIQVVGDRVQLTLTPQPGSGPTIEEIGDSGYRVVTWDKAQRELARLIGAGLDVPSDRRHRLEAVLERCASHFDVARDLAVRRGDTTPTLLLRPAGSGLQAELGVRPGGPDTRLLVPGEGGQQVLLRTPEGAVQLERDLGEEARLAHGIAAALPELLAAEWDGASWLLDELEPSLRLLEQLAALEQPLHVEWPDGGALRLRGRASSSSLSARIDSAEGWFAASGELVVDDELTLDLVALLKLVEQGSSRFVRLDDGAFLALTERFRQQLDALARTGRRRAGRLELHPLASDLLEPLVDDDQVDSSWRAWCDALANPGPPPEVPAGLTATLRPYQLDGFQWLARLAGWGLGACLADDMGLGKTVVSLALLLHRASLGPALVVAPTSVCGTWLAEAWRFAPALRVHQLGSDRAATLAALGPNDVLVCSYGLMVNECEALAELRWSTVVLDEAQAIKNHRTQRHAAAAALTAGARIALTGTPLENHLGELHALASWLNPGLLGSQRAFTSRYQRPIESGDRAVQRQLAARVAPFVLRRTKSQVLQDLPPRTDIDLPVELGPEEAAFYEAVRLRALASLDDTSDHLAILAQLTKLRLAACSPRLVDGGPPLPGAKHRAFVRLVEDLREGGHRALVFSQFVRHLALLRAWLDEQGVPYCYLDGSTPQAVRRRQIDAFQAGEGRLFLISLRAGGVGLNLTAADYVVHMDPWWNPAVEDQASARAHRIGQSRPVTVYRLIAQGTVEERIVELHRQKRDLADQLLEGADQAARLGADELLALLRG